MTKINFKKGFKRLGFVIVIFILCLSFDTFAYSENYASKTFTSVDWSEKTSTMSSGTVWSGDEWYFSIQYPSSIMYHLNPRTIFYGNIPDEISTSRGSYSGPSSKYVVLIQDIKTEPLGKVWLNETSKGPKEEETFFPEWYSKVFFSLLVLVIMGISISVKINKPDSEPGELTTLQSFLIFVPLTPFLGLIAITLIGLIITGLSSEPLCDVFIDNATNENYTISINGQDVRLPSMKNLCVRLRPSRHTLKYTSKSDTTGPSILNMEDAGFRDKYIINLEGANFYRAKVVTYQQKY